jgi:purine-binding chemotaxis protein CheW
MTNERGDAPGKRGITERSSTLYLTFLLGEEVYGLKILAVQEIIGLIHITPVPRMPDYVRGVINLRGKVIPVIDLRIKFGMPTKEDTRQSCIIVVEIPDDDRIVTMGISVDSVSEVMNIPADQVAPPPSVGGAQIDFILGMGKVGNNVVALLDAALVLSNGDLAGVRGIRAAAEESSESLAAAAE